MATPNSLLFLGQIFQTASSTAPVLPGNISTIKKPVNFYVIQTQAANLIAPIFQLQWSLDLNTFFPFRRKDSSIIEFTETDTKGGILTIPRLNPDVFVRVNATGDLGIQPNIDFFIG